MASEDQSLQQYFMERYGVDIRQFGDASNGLQQAVDASRAVQGDRYKADRDAMPELVPTGDIQRSARGSYWIVPTADGIRYVRPEQYLGSANVDSSAFGDSLTENTRTWMPQAPGGWFLAEGPGATKARIGSAMPGTDTMWAPNDQTTYSVWTTPPTERYIPEIKDKGGLFGDSPMSWVVPLIVNHFIPGAGSIFGAGAAGDVAAGGFTGDIAADALASGAFASPSAAAAANMSFGDALVKALDPARMATRAAQNVVTQALTRGEVSPAGVIAGAAGGIAGDTVSGTVGGGLIGGVAGGAAGAAVSAGVGGLINGGPTNPRAPIVVPQSTGPRAGTNAVPETFGLALAPFKPQFNRNTRS